MEFKKPIYPIEQWNITETEFKKENNYRNETTFALSNGYIGTRGTFEEAYPFDVDTGLEGNFVNGFYESNEIRYGEANFGSPLLSQSLLNLPNLKEIHVILDGEEFTMEQGEVKEYARTLHMKDGILERKLTWTASSGKMTEIHIFRLVSFARKNIMAIRYQVRPVNYAGTVEFVLDHTGEFYFIEMNTRIQVEHPITEMVSDVDLVREQIRVAAGLPLGFTQEDIHIKGHAIECRVNAEDPTRNFAPSPARIDFLHVPGGMGVRVDTGIYQGYTVPAQYDSLIAKLDVWAPTRLEALRRCRRALEELIVEGPATNIDLLHQVMYHPQFIHGTYTTSFMDEHLQEILGWDAEQKKVSA